MGQPICSIPGCDRPVLVKMRGWCSLHYCRWQRHGDPNVEPKRARVVGVEPCTIDGCDKKIAARGLCAAHWTRWKRHGSPTARLPGEVVNGRRICTLCGEDKLVGEEINESWCKPCSAQRKGQTRKPYTPKSHPIKQCAHCGAEFRPRLPAQSHCSPECADATRSQRNRKHVLARRARLRRAPSEEFDPFEVFERDGWTCQICRDPVDPDVRWPDPMCVSLDHVVPLSRGGAHTRANTQCAHLSCNTKKGVKPA